MILKSSWARVRSAAGQKRLIVEGRNPQLTRTCQNGVFDIDRSLCSTPSCPAIDSSVIGAFLAEDANG